jgi:hypothetical protein
MSDTVLYIYTGCIGVGVVVYMVMVSRQITRMNKGRRKLK